MMIRALLLAALATPASALSCVPPDPLRAFQEAQAAPESYVVLHGRLDFDPERMPEPVAPPSGGPDVGAPDLLLPPVPARFDGFALTPSGFTRPVAGPLTLQPSCLGPWCGSLAPGENWLLFARVGEGGALTLATGPCEPWAFQNPSESDLAALALCLRGEPCRDQ